ncbi:sensor histidine kinase [Paenibacillus sp. YIM B09110]|uniref:sensor histidine kinase n=1 Tax=Paenibacillus sp. YIM B09110 TaxID=3126102 RepID=UPI00301E21C6
MNGIWRRSILTKLFMLFCLTVLPTYVLSVVLYKWGTEEVIEKINTSSYSQMTQYMDRLEQEVLRMQAIQYEFLNDRDLDRLSTIVDYMPWLEQFYALRGLGQRINMIKNSSAYAKDVSIFLTRAGKVISTSGGISPLEDVSGLDIRNLDPSSKSLVAYRQGELYVDFYNIVTDFSDTNLPLFKIEIMLDKAVFQADLEHFGGEEVNVLMLSDSSASRVIGKSNIDEPNLAEMLDEANKRKGNGEKQGWVEPITINQIDYSMLVVKSEELNMTFVKFVRKGQYLESLEKYTAWFWAFSVISFLAISMFIISMYKVVYNPLRKLSSAFKRVESGNLNMTITDSSNNEFGFIYRSFNRMVHELKVLIEQVYEQRILTQRAQMKQLQSQIHPHFLYNNFQIIYRMAKLEDHENLADLSLKLAQYYQYVTRNTSDDVPLAREVEFARMYVDIQSVRFQNRLVVQFAELPPDCGHIMVPRLILQPVLENTFEHGLRDKAADGRLSVSFEMEDEQFTISIEDNGDALTSEELQRLQTLFNTSGSADAEVTGLVNIHRRIQIKFGKTSGMRATRGSSGGLKITIALSKEANNDV